MSLTSYLQALAAGLTGRAIVARPGGESRRATAVPPDGPPGRATAGGAALAFVLTAAIAAGLPGCGAPQDTAVGPDDAGTPTATDPDAAADEGETTGAEGQATGGPIDLLLAGGTVVTMDGEGSVIAGGAVAVDAGDIVAVGSATELEGRFAADAVLEVDPHDLVVPGLINGHNHAAMTLLRGVADDLRLTEWLEDYIFPAEGATVDEEFVRVGTRLAAMEMIRTGTTTFTDMYYFEDAAAEVVDEVGLRAVLGETIIDFPAPDHPDPQQALSYTGEFIGRWSEHPRITPAPAPHAPYTVSPDVWRAAARLARDRDVPLLTHLSESEDEVRQVRERYDDTSAGLLEDLGVLGPEVVVFHALWLDDDDVERLARHGVGTIHNPESNMKLASGAMPLPRLRAAGIPVGLGTDGPASNNDLDLFAAITVAALLQKHEAGDPTLLPAAEAFGLATREGARALHLGDRIGSLEPGKAADLVVLDGDAPNLVPRYDALSHLAYAGRGGNVRLTVVAGRVLYRDGEYTTLDPTTVVDDARRVARRVREAVGSPGGEATQE